MTMIKESIEIETIQKSTYKTVEIHRLKKKCWGFFWGGINVFGLVFFEGGGWGGLGGLLLFL